MRLLPSTMKMGMEQKRGKEKDPVNAGPPFLYVVDDWTALWDVKTTLINSRRIHDACMRRDRRPGSVQARKHERSEQR